MSGSRPYLISQIAFNQMLLVSACAISGIETSIFWPGDRSRRRVGSAAISVAQLLMFHLQLPFARDTTVILIIESAGEAEPVLSVWTLVTSQTAQSRTSPFLGCLILTGPDQGSCVNSMPESVNLL